MITGRRRPERLVLCCEDPSTQVHAATRIAGQRRERHGRYTRLSLSPVFGFHSAIARGDNTGTLNDELCPGERVPVYHAALGVPHVSKEGGGTGARGSPTEVRTRKVMSLASELMLLLSEDGADPERVEALTRHLRRELDQLDVGAVSPLPMGQAPEGTRAFEVAALGGLLVALTGPVEAVGKIVAVIREWLSRTPGPVRTVRLELAGDVLELSEASAAEQDRLVQLFVSRHTSSGST